MRWLAYLLTFGLAAVLSAVLTPRVRDAALRFGIVDRPDGRLKQHREPVPYLGGLAICLSFLLAVALTFSFDEEVLGLLLAGSIVVILGLVDDLGQLGPWAKLAGQLVAIVVLIKSGIYIKLTFLGEPLAIALSVIWLLAITNAFNLIDIMDGLSAGTAMIAALVLAVVSDFAASTASATLLVALAGSCLGFLRYNFEPARIYMGDTGSMFLGLLLGTTFSIRTRSSDRVPSRRWFAACARHPRQDSSAAPWSCRTAALNSQRGASQPRSASC